MGIPFIFNTKNMSGEISHANERERYIFNCIFGMLGQWFISNESIKCVSPSCSVNAISHILTSLFTRNKTQLAINERQHTGGSKGGNDETSSSTAESWVEWGWGALGSFDSSQSGPRGSVERQFPSPYSGKALGKLGKTATHKLLLMPIAQYGERRVKRHCGQLDWFPI